MAPGEKVITQGIGNLSDGAKIKPVPRTAPQRTQARRPEPPSPPAAGRNLHVAHLHRSADLRLGDRDHHHADRHWRHHQLPIAQYPDVAPPQVNIRATYPGASAQTLQDSVTQVLEQQLTGLDGLIYFQSSSSSRGQATINVTFEKGTDPDIAQVQVQNVVQPALSRLPQQVQQQGVRVTKSSTDFLLIIGVYDESGRTTDMDVSDWLSSNMQDTIARVPGVGDVNVFGAPYAMRIWLDPAKLRSYSLMPGDVINAISSQNVEVAAGEVGGTPALPGQMLNATVTASSRFQTPEQFRNIIVKAEASGARVRLSDVARVELGAENYNSDRRLNGKPGAGIAIFLAPGADALETADTVKARVEQLAKTSRPATATPTPTTPPTSSSCRSRRW